jgi:hypothetical protein
MGIIDHQTDFTLYDFEAITPQVLDFLKAKVSIRKDEKVYLRLFGILECFLQITSKRLRIEHLYSAGFSSTYEQFLGALYSENFFSGSIYTRYVYAYRWKYLASKILDLHLPHKQASIKPKSGSIDSRIVTLVNSFDTTQVDARKVAYWKGWKVTSHKGAIHSLPLQRVFLKFGDRFAEKLKDDVQLFFEVYRVERLVCLKQFAEFICSDDHTNLLSLLDPLFATHMWRRLMLYCLKDYENRGLKIETVQSDWSLFSNFAKAYLFKNEYFSAPLGNIPYFSKSIQSEPTNTSLNEKGQLINHKLLVDVPLHLTDDEALQSLIEKINFSFNVVEKWATHEVKNIWDRYSTLESEALKGTATLIDQDTGKNNGNGSKISDSNINLFSNTAATFKKYGYMQTATQNLKLLYPLPLRNTANQLALPTIDNLFPFLVALICEHSIITSSFLESLELYDKNGKLVGVVKSDTGVRLVGYKRRKGPKRAQQIIKLTDWSALVIKILIEITKPIRDVLRKEGDDSWRLLLITCGSTFGKPRKYTFKAGSLGKDRMTHVIKKLMKVNEISLETATEIYSGMCLSSIRATGGVVTFLKNGSVHEMAESLGHTEYDHRLLNRYLPKPISKFFRDRWIRIFQNGIIAEALKDSKHFSNVLDLQIKYRDRYE